MVPWKSRWSWLRFVKTRTAKRTSRSRFCSGRAGGLEGGAEIAGVEHLAESALQVDRLGRRRLPCARCPRGSRSSPAAQLPSSGLEDRVQKEGRRRLAVRPGDGSDLELLRRPAEELGGRVSHGLAHVHDDDLRHSGRDRVSRRAQRRRPRPAPRHIVPVRALTRHAEEEVPGRTARLS